MTVNRAPLIRAILIGGIVASTIDIGAACLISGRSLPYILHTVAGGLLAKQAFAGGVQTAVLGLLLQWAMGCIIAAVYVIAAQSLTALRR
jgi:hypothetical protein